MNNEEALEKLKKVRKNCLLSEKNTNDLNMIITQLEKEIKEKKEND